LNFGLRISGFPLESTPYLIRGGNDTTCAIYYVVMYRLGVQSAILFLNDAKAFEVEWVDSTLHQEAKEELERIGRQRINFVDCTSFVVMRRKGVQTALAFDPDFHHQGFLIY